MKYGLIGEKLGHSYSKDIHEQLADYKYEIKEIARENLDAFIESKDFKAINVTIPYKQDVIKHLDWKSEALEEIGACNAIVNRDGKLYGYNFDAAGLEALIKHAKVDVKDRDVVILGSGGTSKTAQYVVKKLGCKSLKVASIMGEPGTITYEEIPEDTEIFVNTTPLGMFPNNYAQAISLAKYKNVKGVIDVVYNPLKTQLVIEAKKRGIPAESGLYMLVAQAFYGAQEFIGKQLDPKKIDEIYNDLLKKKRNIVLIGMPTCGKTTTGKELASILDKQFMDTDELILKMIDGPISDYIHTHGEQKFRDLETEVVKEAAKKAGSIIATGGGAILREKNVDALKQNGIIYFIDRPLEELMVASDRPLSSSKEALTKLYHDRYDIYRSVADKIVDGSGKGVANVVKQIKKEEAK